jgi:hypothetical protein
MDQRSDGGIHPTQEYHWYSRRSLRGKSDPRRYLIVFVASSLLLSTLLSCLLGQFALHHSIIKPPCFGRYFSDPFTEPSHYVKLGPPRERQFYDIEFGRSLPVITGVADTHLLLLRFPIDFPHPCFP